MGTLQTETSPHGTADEGQTPSRKRFAKYLLLVLLIPLLFYPLPFFIATSASYEHWSTSQWGPMLEYAYDPAPKNADVLIFGDSSAFIGINPKILNAKFGIHSVVLPDTIGSIPVTRDTPLKSYLAHNAPPRLLVLYFSAWNLDFDHIAKVRQFEGEEMMLRHESWSEITHFTAHHPLEMLRFPLRLYSTFGPKMITAALHHVNREQTTANSLGHADFNDMIFGPLTPNCSLPSSLLAETGISSVQDLVRQYTTPQVRVVVYIAPVPDCGGSHTLETRSYAGLHATPPEVLPARDFVGDSYYAHSTPTAVPAITAAFASWLAPELVAHASSAAQSGLSPDGAGPEQSPRAAPERKDDRAGPGAAR